MRFAASLSACTVGNTLSPKLQTAGTTVRSWRKSSNRLRSISLFSSPPLETAWSDTHRGIDIFHGSWVYPFSPPSGLVRLLGYSYNPLTWLAPYCPSASPCDFSTVAPLGYPQSSYCTASVADVDTLDSE